MKKIYFTLLALLLIFLYVLKFQYPKLNIVAGYTAKDMATQVFFAHRHPDSVRQTDHNLPLLKLAKAVVDTVKRTATSTVFGFCERTAVFQEDKGATLLPPDERDNLPNPTIKRAQPLLPKPYPHGNGVAKDTLFAVWDYQKINQALDLAFQEIDSEQPKNTRAILMLYKGYLLIERYAKGFDAHTPMIGWSMTKSVAATLIGILAYQGLLDIHQPLYQLKGFEDWGKDDRKTITTAHLLAMNSGLKWVEDYGIICDVTRMLYLDKDMTERPYKSKLQTKAGTTFYYSTGTSMLLSKVINACLNATKEEAYTFPYRALLDKIGMYSSLIESDYEGNFAFGSYAWATARDWAKLGLLYLQKGSWQGERIFAENWIPYVTSAKTSPIFGGHFWTNENLELYPDLPKDTYSMNGHHGQRVVIIPTMDLVLVRMGLTPAREGDEDLNKMTNEMVVPFLSALKK